MKTSSNLSGKFSIYKVDNTKVTKKLNLDESGKSISIDELFKKTIQ